MIHRGARSEQLAVGRLAVFGIWFAIVAGTPVSQFARLPHEAITPRGVVSLLPLEAVLSSPEALVALKGLALLGCAACVLGVRPWVPVALTTFLVLLVFDGSMKSIGGFVNHAQFGALYAALILAVSPAADAFSITGRRDHDAAPLWRYGGPMLAIGTVITAAYSFIGTRRLVRGSLGVFTDGSIEVWVVARTLEYAEYSHRLGLALLENDLVAWGFALGMFITTIFEIASPLALRYRAFRWAWLGVMIPFHIGTRLTMNIFFWENLVLILVFLTPITRHAVRGGQLGRPQSRHRPWTTSSTEVTAKS